MRLRRRRIGHDLPCRRGRSARDSRTTPAGSRLLPALQRPRAPASMHNAPAGCKRSGDPLLARRDRRRRRARTRCSARPPRSGCSGVRRVARPRCTCGSPRPPRSCAARILVAMPPEPTSEAERPAIASISGVIAVPPAMNRGVGIAVRIGGDTARRHPRAAPGSRRWPSARRARPAGRCRRSGSPPWPPCRSR